MTPTQRAAAERLAKQLDFLVQPFAHNAADLLRELLAEPQGEPVAWMTYREDGRILLWPTRGEALLYCEVEEEPIPLYPGEPT